MHGVVEVASIVAEVVLAKPEQVFDFVTDTETLPKVFLGYGPIPRIEAAEIVGGGAIREGAVRVVKNSDGSVIHERITACRRPTLQAYKLESGFVAPLSYLIRSANGRWTFEPQEDGTRITWRFAFEASSIVFWPLLAVITNVYFSKAQVRCLAEIKRRIEATD